VGRVQTIKVFSPALLDETTLVVPLEEMNHYVAAYQATGICDVMGVDAKGIARTREEIGRYAGVNGQDTFVMMDDDLSFFVREPGTTKLIKATPADMDSIVYAMEMELLNTSGTANVAHTSVSTRQGNNNLDLPCEFNTRTLRVLAYRTELFNKMEHGRVPVMEDFDVNLQLLEAGYHNSVLSWCAQDQAQTQAAGGCSTYRTHELQEQAAVRLAELHPGVVKVRDKVNKTGGEFGTRKDVTIYWKKALKLMTNGG
jgi:hypothetical protein